MNWSAFLGATLGTLLMGVVVVVFLVIDSLTRRPPPDEGKGPLVVIPERRLERSVVKHFGELFPGWHVYDTEPPNPPGRERGIQFKCPRVGQIDILALDDHGDLVLKRAKAPDKTVAQVDRYITWVERNLAKDGQKVKALIIAQSFGPQIEHILAQRSNIQALSYEWKPVLHQA
jgi:hypothetical protein